MKATICMIIVLAVLAAAAPAAAQTPTPPPDITNLVLDNGATVAIEYKWTFGEIAIVTLLLFLNVQLAARAVYDVIYQVWNRRKVIVSE